MRILFLLCLSICVLSCKKTETPDPDYTSGLTGAYPVTYYREGTQFVNLPSASGSGVFDITKVDLTHVSAKLTMTYGGKSTVYSTNTFELKPAPTTGTFLASINGTSVGSISPTAIDVSAVSPDGTVTQIKANR